MNDPEMIELANAPDEEQLVYDAIYSFASAIGQRKGYGSEGIGELQTEFVDEIYNSIGAKFDWDEGTSMQDTEGASDEYPEA